MIPLARLRKLALTLLLCGCRDATAPAEPEPFPAANVGGSFVLIRAAGSPIDQTCFSFIDPAWSGIASLGLLTFDTTSHEVRQQEVRVSCLGRGDTMEVDQQRDYRVRGPHVFVERPSGPLGATVDTGSVVGNTLAFRRGGNDFVYERVTTSDAAFYFLTSDLNSWMVGEALFTTNGPASSTWEVQMLPTHFVRNQQLFFFRPEGRPGRGTYTIGHWKTAPFYARMHRDLPGGGQTFESTSGTITIAQSTSERVEGSFDISMDDGVGGTVRLQGRFVARCSRLDGCD